MIFLQQKLFIILSLSDQDEPKRKGKRPRGGNSAFLAPLKLSDALVKFLGTGESALPRSGVVKRIWDYIKLNNLQVNVITAYPSSSKENQCCNFSVESFMEEFFFD